MWRGSGLAGAQVIGKTNVSTSSLPALLGGPRPTSRGRGGRVGARRPRRGSAASDGARHRLLAPRHRQAGHRLRRIPAGPNSIVGLKPSIGAISAAGRRTGLPDVDLCVIFGLSVIDAWRVQRRSGGPDACRRLLRRSFPATGVMVRPTAALHVGNPTETQRRSFGAAGCAGVRVRRSIDLRAAAPHVELPFADFDAAADLLYEGALRWWSCAHPRLHGLACRRLHASGDPRRSSATRAKSCRRPMAFDGLLQARRKAAAGEARSRSWEAVDRSRRAPPAPTSRVEVEPGLEADRRPQRASSAPTPTSSICSTLAALVPCRARGRDDGLPMRRDAARRPVEGRPAALAA